jgi:hypothetical protein
VTAAHLAADRLNAVEEVEDPAGEKAEPNNGWQTATARRLNLSFVSR